MSDVPCSEVCIGRVVRGGAVRGLVECDELGNPGGSPFMVWRQRVGALYRYQDVTSFESNSDRIDYSVVIWSGMTHDQERMGEMSDA